MGVKTYETFKTDLVLETGARTDFTDTLQGQYINAAYLDFCTRNTFWGLRLPYRFMFPELNTSTTISTVAERAWVSVPTDMIVTTTIHDTTNDNKLKNMAWRDYVRRTGRGDSDESGDPTHWARYGGYYYLWPTPDAAYVLEVFYRKRPALLSTSSSVTVVGSEWDEAILKLAVIQTLMRFKDYESAMIEKKEWVDMMASKIGIYTQDLGDRGDYLKPDQSYHQWEY